MHIRQSFDQVQRRLVMIKGQALANKLRCLVMEN